jgi:hypothetical protein
MRRHYLAATAALLVGSSRPGPGREPAAIGRPLLANSAIASLERAEHDKGGHRAKALELARQAREEVKAGMAFANTH